MLLPRSGVSAPLAYVAEKFRSQQQHAARKIKNPDPVGPTDPELLQHPFSLRIY
ncbi:hypothetical protein D3C87_1418490 [compost metagenome]